MSIKNVKKGFTLIELLVVIAIIGILSGVVLASLNTARQRARDSQRISDLRQYVIALELYFEANNTYVDNPGSETVTVALTGPLAPYLPVLPIEPLVGAQTYQYNGSANDFCIGVDLENVAPPKNNKPACLAAGTSPIKLTGTADYAVGP